MFVHLYYVVRKNGAINTTSLVHGYNLVKRGFVLALCRASDHVVIRYAE